MNIMHVVYVCNVCYECVLCMHVLMYVMRDTYVMMSVCISCMYVWYVCM